jgi:hypothetical protein
MSNARSLWTLAAAALVLFLVVPACGGGAGGAGGAGRGLVLLSFRQDGVDNVVLNTRLELEFSEAVNPATIGPSSVQLREGPSFGQTVAGTFIVTGAKVIFEPRLPSLCDLSDSALKPDTDYRLQVVGAPAEFAVRNMSGQSLSTTSTHQFRTREEIDPTKYADQIPGAPPSVTATSPANGDDAVPVVAGNQVVITMTENLDPCSVSTTSVLLRMYEIGDPAVEATGSSGKKSGFSSDGTNAGVTTDQAPLNDTTWGSGGGITSLAGAPQTIPANVTLIQEFASTRIVVTPLFGYNPDPLKNASKFPENALLVVDLTADIRDFGGQSLTPQRFSFTTENLLGSASEYKLQNDGETPYVDTATTADVNTARAPSRVQGYMLFSGDGDNGANPLKHSGPNTPVSGCVTPYQANDGIKDDFDPGGDVLLDTGATPNTCDNATDGSTAVVWEFQTFHIRAGITVRVVGVNPAIFLVEGDVLIDNGGRLLLRGDNSGGAPNGNGQTGRDPAGGGADTLRPGGVGVAGGGDGGDATKIENSNQNWKYGHDGNAGFGSADYDPSMAPVIPTASTDDAPEGGGEGGAPVGISGSTAWDGTSSAGGGGGHATVGIDGQAPNNGTVWTLKLPIRSNGGKVYGDADTRLLVPQAGSGGGASGQAKDQPWRNASTEGTGGGSGGAGGGFVDLTSSGNISIFGELDASGGRGGDGQRWSNSGDRGITGGGGGGSGGGIRLLTPNEIILGGTTVMTAAGGIGGVGARHAVTRPPQIVKEDNDGGDGGNGRIAMEDGDSIISGIGAASVTPSEGSVGFYRGIFDASRFKGGGLKPVATTDIFPTGPFNPVYVQPVPADFAAGLPTAGAPGIGKTGILIEARGYQIQPDGTPDLASASAWYTIGSFTDTGVETLPAWSDGHPVGASAVPIPADNALNTVGAGEETFVRLNAAAPGDGFEFLQIRISIFLPVSITPVDAGGFLDNWTIRFTHDQ